NLSHRCTDVLSLERVIEQAAIERAVIADCGTEGDVDVEAQSHYCDPARPPLHFRSALPSPRSPARNWARAWPPERAGSDGLREALLRVFQSVCRSSTPPFGGSSR